MEVGQQRILNRSLLIVVRSVFRQGICDLSRRMLTVRLLIFFLHRSINLLDIPALYLANMSWCIGRIAVQMSSFVIFAEN